MNKYILLIGSLGLLLGCEVPQRKPSGIPALQYADAVRREQALNDGVPSRIRIPTTNSQQISKDILPLGRFTSLDDTPRARVTLVSDEIPLEASGPGKGIPSDSLPHHIIPQEPPPFGLGSPESKRHERDGYSMYESRNDFTRGYTGPLSLGEPGVTSSLWREGRGSNDLWKDVRAWLPMDLITIVVSEQAEGKKAANTEVKQSSTIALAISKLLGLETEAKKANSANGLDPTALVTASSQNDFKGQGTTDRKDSLTAKMSAMIAEVLPSGILRIEGQKIIAVNGEEQVMVISGLIRPRDISSTNEVDSSRIANMRIDYYGNGTVDEAQHGGWLGRFLRVFWPF